MESEIKLCPFCGSSNEVYPGAYLVDCENHWKDGAFLAIKKDEWQNAYCWKELERKDALITKLVDVVRQYQSVLESNDHPHTSWSVYKEGNEIMALVKSSGEGAGGEGS